MNQPLPAPPPEEITIEVHATVDGWVARPDAEALRALALLPGARTDGELLIPRAELRENNDPASLDTNAIAVCKAFGGKDWHKAPYRWGVVFEGKEIFWHPLRKL